MSDAKARRELGYEPIVTREDGLAAMRAAAAAVAPDVSTPRPPPDARSGASLER